jgi:hypothetical protein
VFVLLRPTDEIEGRAVRFVDGNTDVTAYYANRPATRLARLIVSPESAGRGTGPADGSPLSPRAADSR